ncbi:MAG: hypothetical protein GX605_12170 [Chloroflexi bacterium]|nr:hypothetical protein [Chloroflexota bacterium]
MAQTDRLTAQQRAFVVALFGHTVEGAAAGVGISPRTAWRWLALAHVKEAVQHAQQEALEAVTRRAVQAMTGALAVLQEVAADRQSPTGSRVSAARAILENGLRFAEVVTLEARIAALEEARKSGAS